MSGPASHSFGEAKPLLPSNWTELAPFVDRVLDAPPAAREQLIAELSGGDAARRAHLEQLVAECEQQMPLLDRPAAEGFASLFAHEAEPSMPEVLGGRYRMEREIGRGGMARVYLAHDIKHGRDVAVKVVRPDIAASLGRERFLREIAIAARLRHPNIVPLYDSGDADGLLYFVMPYEEGPSLRARLTEADTLSVPERVSVLRDVARALAYAHEHGVVHRDVKPDNVMLSGGAAVVADFGIAKAVRAAQFDASPASTITQGGAGIGTPAYMAPEQAIGDPSTDHRADIYSFGCLAYEMFAGKPPFHGMPAHQIIAAHVGTTPTLISDVCADVPSSIARLIATCLEKNPDARPQSALELVRELERSVDVPTASIPAVVAKPPWMVLALLTALVIASAGYIIASRRPREATIAVLPMESTGGDSLQRELAGGLSDEVANALFGVPGVRVMSRRGVGNYRGQRDLDYTKIGRELGARYLVMGSLRLVDGQWRVLASLVDVRDGSIAWSDQFDRKQNELGLVRVDIAAAVGRTLQRTLGSAVTDTPAHRVARVNEEAYRFYILAQRALDRRGQSIRASVDNFRRATEIDTTFAEAHSGLSLALALTPYFQPTSSEAVSGDAVRMAQRAMRLDPTLAQPHTALGVVYMNAYDWRHAEEEFQTAVRLDARDVEARVQYGRMLMFRDRTSGALNQFLAARREDPASALVSSWVSYAYYIAGQRDSALVESERAFQSDSTNITTLALGSLVRLQNGQIERAREFVRRLPPFHGISLFVLGAVGDRAAVRERLRALDVAQPPPPSPQSTRAFALLGVGDTAAALSALERATDAKEIWPSLQANLDPIFDQIRGSPRYLALLKRVGLR